MPSIINSDDGVVSGTSGLKTTGGNDGITTFQQNGTEAARIDASRNFLLGTTSALVAGTGSISAANTFGYKNRIINGSMSIAQRATSATVTAGTGVPTASTGYPAVDRFFVYSTGANVTAARVAGTGAVQHRMQITGAASVTAIGVGQRIEQLNSYDLAGSTATLSVDLANSLLTTVTWTASYANTADTFGTIGTPTKTQIATGTFTVTSTVTNYSVNISIPAAATTGIEILFTVGAQTSGTWTIGNVQLEKGSVETAFDYRPYGTELALCQRYYERLTPSSGSANTLTFSGTVVPDRRSSSFPFKVSKRANPSLLLYGFGGTSGQVEILATGSGGSNANYNSIQSNTESFWVIVNGGSGTGIFAFYSPSYAEIEL